MSYRRSQLDFLLSKAPVLISTIFLLSILSTMVLVLNNFRYIDLSSKECENIAGIINMLSVSSNESVTYSISLPGHIVVEDKIITFNGVTRELLYDVMPSEFNATEAVQINKVDGAIQLSGDS